MMNLAEYRRTASRLADYLPWVALVGDLEHEQYHVDDTSRG